MPSPIQPRHVESIEVPDVGCSKRKRTDEDAERDSEQEEPQISKQRRASILPGSIAYNEAIMASFDAVDIADDQVQSSSSESGDSNSEESPVDERSPDEKSGDDNDEENENDEEDHADDESHSDPIN